MRRVVVIVDSDRATREGLRAGLEYLGVEVSEADGPSAALEAIEHAKPAVVVLDHLFHADAALTGTELAAIIARAHPTIGVILFSEDIDHDQRFAGVDSVVNKLEGSASLTDAVLALLAQQATTAHGLW